MKPGQTQMMLEEAVRTAEDGHSVLIVGANEAHCDQLRRRVRDMASDNAQGHIRFMSQADSMLDVSHGYPGICRGVRNAHIFWDHYAFNCFLDRAYPRRIYLPSGRAVGSDEEVNDALERLP